MGRGTPESTPTLPSLLSLYRILCRSPTVSTHVESCQSRRFGDRREEKSKEEVETNKDELVSLRRGRRVGILHHEGHGSAGHDRTLSCRHLKVLKTFGQQVVSVIIVN